MFNKTFIWGHRGAGFIGTQNTLVSFKKAIDLGVDGLKTEAKLSKTGDILVTDKETLKIDGINRPISDLTLKEIKQVRLANGEPIPTLYEVFNEFRAYNIKYNFDIMTPEVGIKIIEVAKEYNLVNDIEIGKPSIYPNSLYSFFSNIRKQDKEVTLSNSVFLYHSKITKECLEIEDMIRLNISIININYNYVNHETFKMIKDLGFKFYIWGVLFERNMKKLLSMRYNNEYIDGIFSNQADRLVKLRNQIQN